MSGFAAGVAADQLGPLLGVIRGKLTCGAVLGLHVETKKTVFLGSVFEAEGVNDILPISRFCRKGEDNRDRATNLQFETFFSCGL